jgi:hypothetical protein
MFRIRIPVLELPALASALFPEMDKTNGEERRLVGCDAVSHMA